MHKKDSGKMKVVCLVLVVLLLSGCTSQESPQEIPDSESVDEPLKGEEVPDQIVLEGDVEITFVRNDGFLIVSGDTKILIDALYTGDQEWSAPQEVQELLVKGEPPFDEVDLVLVTHAHWDHFDAEAVGKHLENNLNAVFISTSEAVNSLKMAFPNLEGMQERVIAVQPEDGKRISLTANGIDIEVLNLHHGFDVPMRNNGYLFTVGGVKILHTGDWAGPFFKARDYQLPNEGIDIAFMPHFYLQEMWDYIQPKYTVPMHFDDPDSQNPDVKRIEALSYDFIMFYQSMQTVSIREFLEEQEKGATVLRASGYALFIYLHYMRAYTYT